MRNVLCAACPQIFDDSNLERIQVQRLDPVSDSEGYPSYAAAWWSLHFNPSWYQQYLLSQSQALKPLFPDEPPQNPFGRAAMAAEAGPVRLHWNVCAITSVWNETFASFSAWDDVIDAALTLLQQAEMSPFAARDSRGDIPGPFAGCEGTVRIGYRAHQSGRWGSQLRLSRCDIYFPK